MDKSCFDNVLYIIGNGFDLHHNIHSSYKYFEAWLVNKNPALYNKLSLICRHDSLWWNFEEALAYVDRDYFLNAGELLLPKEWSEDDSVAELFYASDIVRSEAEGLWDEIVKWFRKWIVTVSWQRESNSRKLMIDAYARFVTFNYTPFLESRYGIDSQNILYIHGRQGSCKCPPIIGHGDTDSFPEWFGKKHNHRRRYYKGGTSILPEVEMMTESAEYYFQLSEKPVGRIISKNKAFIDDLYDVRHIFVLGHSMNRVDIPYFLSIVDANDAPNDISWHVSYYDEKEKRRLLDVFSSLIPTTHMNLNMFRLVDVMITR